MHVPHAVQLVAGAASLFLGLSANAQVSPGKITADPKSISKAPALMPDLPDLVVQSIRIDPPNPKSYQVVSPSTFGSGFNVWATIKNQGKKEAFLGKGWQLAAARFAGWRPTQFYGTELKDNISLAPGASIEVLAEAYRNEEKSPHGVWVVTVRADPQNQVTEENETNNEKNAQVKVEWVMPPAQPQANTRGSGDLVISQVRLDPADKVTVRGDFKIVVVVKNIGGEDVRIPPLYAFIYEVSGHADIYSERNELILKPDQQVEYRTDPRKLQAGTTTWRFRLNAIGNIQENRNNNEKELQVTVSP